MAQPFSSEDASRADYRLISYILRTFIADTKVVHDPSAFDRIGSAFKRAKGSWERIFRGSASDFNLLRKIVKVAVKAGILKKLPGFR